MNRLERRYRRLLGSLPGWYRERREDEMVEVFLAGRPARGTDDEELDGEYGWPGWAEAASVMALAVRTRVGGVGAPAGPRALGDAVRAAALGGVLLGAASAAAGLIGQVVVVLVGIPGARELGSGLVHPTGMQGWWNTLVLVLGLGWLPAWTAMASDRVRVAALLVLAACLPAIVAVATSVPGDTAVLMTLAVALPELLTLALLLAGFHRDAPPPSPRWAWTPLAAATLALFAGALLTSATGAFVQPVAPVLLAVAIAIAVAVALGRCRAPVADGVAIVGVAVTGSGALELVALEGGRSGPAVTVAAGAVATVVAWLSARRARRVESDGNNSDGRPVGPGRAS